MTCNLLNQTARWQLSNVLQTVRLPSENEGPDWLLPQGPAYEVNTTVRDLWD